MSVQNESNSIQDISNILEQFQIQLKLSLQQIDKNIITALDQQEIKHNIQSSGKKTTKDDISYLEFLTKKLDNSNSLRKEIEELKKENSKLTLENTSLFTELTSLKQQISILNGEKLTLVSTNKQLSTNIQIIWHKYLTNKDQQPYNVFYQNPSQISQIFEEINKIFSHNLLNYYAKNCYFLTQLKNLKELFLTLHKLFTSYFSSQHQYELIFKECVNLVQDHTKSIPLNLKQQISILQQFLTHSVIKKKIFEYCSNENELKLFKQSYDQILNQSCELTISASPSPQKLRESKQFDSDCPQEQLFREPKTQFKRKFIYNEIKQQLPKRIKSRNPTIIKQRNNKSLDESNSFQKETQKKNQSFQLNKRQLLFEIKKN